MQIVLNPQRVSLSNLCPWAASWVGCREELQQGKVADSRLLALLWSLALPAGTHLQLNRPERLTDCLATLTVFLYYTSRTHRCHCCRFQQRLPLDDACSTNFQRISSEDGVFFFLFLRKNRDSLNQIKHNMTPMYLIPVTGVCFCFGITSSLVQEFLMFRTYIFFHQPECTLGL